MFTLASRPARVNSQRHLGRSCGQWLFHGLGSRAGGHHRGITAGRRAGMERGDHRNAKFARGALSPPGARAPPPDCAGADRAHRRRVRGRHRIRGAAAWWALLAMVLAGSGYLLLAPSCPPGDGRARVRLLLGEPTRILIPSRGAPAWRRPERRPVREPRPDRRPGPWSRFALANLAGWALTPVVFALTLVLGETPRDATGQRWLANLRSAQGASGSFDAHAGDFRRNHGQRRRGRARSVALSGTARPRRPPSPASSPAAATYTGRRRRHPRVHRGPLRHHRGRAWPPATISPTPT